MPPEGTKVTLYLLCEEYKMDNPDGYGYTFVHATHSQKQELDLMFNTFKNGDYDLEIQPRPLPCIYFLKYCTLLEQDQVE